jgi:hypothetical protein
MRAFFGFGNSNGKLFISRATNRLVVRQQDNIKKLAAMNVGGWGDPHLYIRQAQTLNPNNYSSGKFLAKWGDNKVGSGGTELLLLDVETRLMKLKVYYTVKNWKTAKAIESFRIVHNNVTRTFNNTAYTTIGPITISIIKVGTGALSYLNFEMKWNTIYNITKLGGALTMILRKVADSGGFWVGKDGRTWDGYGEAGQTYGLTRASFETSVGGLSIDENSNDMFRVQDIILSDEDLETINVAQIEESDILDDLTDESTNESVSVWDQSVLGDVEEGIEGSLTIFETHGTIDHHLANLVNNGATIEGMSAGTASSIISNFTANNVSYDDGYVSGNSIIDDNFIP